MKLYINTTQSDKLIVKVGDEVVESEARKEKSQLLLVTIDDLLQKQGKTTKDLTEIEVETGPGSFTGIRVGVSVAQALGWSLGIPVNGINLSKGQAMKIDY